MNQNITNIKRALISVSDKSGIVDFAQELHNLGVEIVSTGGTAKLLTENNIPNIEISDYTGFPEMMDGRVKTLHPLVHGGILGLRDEHAKVAEENKIGWIDLIVVNLYPFQKTTEKPNVTLEEVIENIDIGGPSMIRSGSKNYGYVTTIVEPGDYSIVLEELKEGGVKFETRQELAIKAFGQTAKYDTFINSYLSKKLLDSSLDFPTDLTLQYELKQSLRYGENPNQKAALYKIPNSNSAILDARIHQGIELSYNNVLDCEAAYNIVKEFVDPACVVIKHTNPCGVATDADIVTAFERAYNADALSAFGGIISLNRKCTKSIAESISKVFAEIVIAPEYDAEALVILSKKKKLRVLEISDFYRQGSSMEYKSINGGLLVQESNQFNVELESLELKTTMRASDEDLSTAMFGWKVLKHVKSNGILIAKDNTTVGIGMGQVSRVDAVELALKKAGENSVGSVLLSDAFFPFRDSIDLIAKYGIRTIIQPGGSMRDQEVIDACNEHGIAMYFTGNRCFKH
jgi:phosphoribosylaminoimidazolecarboxamide formyltransferase / IMP cyclohydrolase